MKTKIDRLTVDQWIRYFGYKVRKSIFRFLFVQIGKANLFWAIFAYLFFFNYREQAFVVKQLEIAQHKFKAIVRRHPRKYNVIYEGLYS